MRDIAILIVVVAGALAALRRPWIGVMLWTWLSLMNPHRYAYGFAYSAPLAQIAVLTTMIGFFVTKDRASPFKGPPVYLFAIFVAWITLSWLAGLDVADDYEQWKKVMKIDFMVFVALALLHNKQHIFALVWTSCLSLALLGMKGGVFTISTGGSGRVWGPPGSFIADNNEFGLSLVMTIPLLRFLQMQISNRLIRLGLTAAMLLCAVAALGTQSRGALLAITSMAVLLWWRGKNKLNAGILIVVLAPVLLAFMPDTWWDRMGTMQTYQSDASAMGRINSWIAAWNLAFHYPLGVGFNPTRPWLFELYAPDPTVMQAAHSIYFQVLGNHGFIGLAIFLGIGVLTWTSASWVRKASQKIPQARWCSDLAGMCQVSLIGYAVGGTFLSLAYFDLPYTIMTLVVLCRVWVHSKGWEREPVYPPGWRTIPGLETPQDPPPPKTKAKAAGI